MNISRRREKKLMKQNPQLCGTAVLLFVFHSFCRAFFSRTEWTESYINQIKLTKINASCCDWGKICLQEKCVKLF